jgi:transposase InsO family protein
VDGAGWETLFVAIDDHARIAFTAMHPDEKTPQAVQFLNDAVAYYAKLGVGIKRLLTDNGSAFRSRDFARACAGLGIQHRFTRAYRPQTNGKAERFIQSALREWAYGWTYQNSTQVARERADVRAAATDDFDIQLGVAPGEHAPFVDGDLHRLEVRRRSFPRQPIGTLSGDALGRIRGRNLGDDPGERRQRILDRLTRRWRCMAGRSPFQVVGVRLAAEAHRGDIPLGLSAHVRQQPRRAPEQQHEQSGGERIERAGVPDARLSDGASRGKHHVV